MSFSRVTLDHPALQVIDTSSNSFDSLLPHSITSTSSITWSVSCNDLEAGNRTTTGEIAGFLESLTSDSLL